jgi:hypothetical protein
LKNDVQNDRIVRGLAVLQRWLELDLLGSVHRSVVQSMPQSANYSQHMYFTGRFEHSLKKHLTLDVLGSAFVCVDGSWLGKDFRRHDFRYRRGRGTRLHGGRSGNVIAESRLIELRHE